jgi:hypothetical protein
MWMAGTKPGHDERTSHIEGIEQENPRNGCGFFAALRNQRQSVVLAKAGSERVERRTLRDGICVISLPASSIARTSRILLKYL